MNSVITAEQAKNITHGRTPLVPIQYEAALKSLQECVTLDEAKTWSDKADALAAWARIYRNDEVGRKAKQLKLHAYRRMGALAGELRPRKSGGRYRDGKFCGGFPGPTSLLKESGLSPNQARDARRLAKISQEKFDGYIERAHIPSPTIIGTERLSSSESWKAITTGGLFSIRSFCRRYPAASLARGLRFDEVPSAQAMITEFMEWLDELERHLPKK